MKKILGFLLCLMIVLSVAGCKPVKPDNIPYEPNTPAPDPHTGTFESECGTLTFNGNGKTIVCDLNREFADLTGLPEGKNEGNYVFLSGDLPPNGSVEVRYDVAHELEITVNDSRIVLELGIASRDGSSAQAGVDVVTANRIPILLKKDGKMVTVTFVKK